MVLEISKFEEKINKASKEWMDYSEDELARIKYRWEFIRRNEKFRKLCKEADESNYLGKLATEFGLSGYIDPETSFDEYVEFWLSQPKVKSLDEVRKFAAGVLDMLHIAPENPISVDASVRYQLKISIDFEQINSITTLKQKISSILDTHWNEYLLETISEDRILRKKADYDLILRIGDLIKFNKMKKTEVAREIFKNDFDLTSAKIKV